MVVDRIVETALIDLIVLYRQPILKLGKTREEDRISHYEILTRFNYNNQHQMPWSWVQSLEEHGLCYLLDRRVVAMLSGYIEQSQDPSIYSVNVSAQTINLNGAFVDHVESLKLPRSIIFEITESVVINLCKDVSEECSIHAMNSITHLSREFTLAIDDFGIGAFRLAHLDSIKPKYVKIDGSFTREIDNPTTVSDISAISQIAHTRGCQVVLEWVETPEQLEIARAIGIDYVQGYGIAKPELLL